MAVAVAVFPVVWCIAAAGAVADTDKPVDGVMASRESTTGSPTDPAARAVRIQKGIDMSDSSSTPSRLLTSRRLGWLAAAAIGAAITVASVISRSGARNGTH